MPVVVPPVPFGITAGTAAEGDDMVARDAAVLADAEAAAGVLIAALTAQLAALTPPALDYSSEYNSAYI